jgi:hypothetical protein
VYTVDYNNYCVFKYTDTGTYCTKWGHQGTAAGCFGVLSCGIEVDSTGIVYVSDYGNRRMDDFSLDGGFLCQWGNTGANALGTFDYFALSPSGDKMYIEDHNTVKVFAH